MFKKIFKSFREKAAGHPRDAEEELKEFAVISRAIYDQEKLAEVIGDFVGDKGFGDQVDHVTTEFLEEVIPGISRTSERNLALAERIVCTLINAALHAKDSYLASQYEFNGLCRTQYATRKEITEICGPNAAACYVQNQLKIVLPLPGTVTDAQLSAYRKHELWHHITGVMLSELGRGSDHQLREYGYFERMLDSDLSGREKIDILLKLPYREVRDELISQLSSPGEWGRLFDVLYHYRHLEDFFKRADISSLEHKALLRSAMNEGQNELRKLAHIVDGIHTQFMELYGDDYFLSEHGNWAVVNFRNIIISQPISDWYKLLKSHFGKVLKASEFAGDDIEIIDSTAFAKLVGR